MGRIETFNHDMDDIENSYEFQNIDEVIEETLKEISSYTENDKPLLLNLLLQSFSMIDEIDECCDYLSSKAIILKSENYDVQKQRNLSQEQLQQTADNCLLIMPVFEGLAILLGIIMGTSITECAQIFMNMTITIGLSYEISKQYFLSDYRKKKLNNKSDKITAEIETLKRAAEYLKVAKYISDVEIKAIITKLEEFIPATQEKTEMDNHFFVDIKNNVFEVNIIKGNSLVRKRKKDD